MWLNTSNNIFKRNIIIVALLVLSAEILLFKLWEIDISVPFNYWGDTLWFMVLVKALIQNGLPYFVEQLSAPFGLSAAGFPSMTNFDWAMMKIISIFVSEPGAVINIYWLLTIVLTGCSAVISFYLLGMHGFFAIIASLIYAFLPYVFFRNVAHLNVVYYVVPLILVYCIYLAEGCCKSISEKINVWGVIALVIQGFNYIYFSFFSLIVIAYSSIRGYIRYKSNDSLKKGIATSLLIIFISAINLTPSFHSWLKYGKPPDMNYKSAAEAEVYGLKLRKMLVPNEENKIPLIGVWAKKDIAAKFPNENENISARLGPLASCGFVLIILACLGLMKDNPRGANSRIETVSLIAIFIFLFSTVGGVGAIFNLIIPDFRAYNRFSVFLAFLSLVVLVEWWEFRVKNCNVWWHKKIFISGFVIVAIVSMYDQILDARYLNNRRDADVQNYYEEKRLVKIIEDSGISDVNVLQLPFVAFPSDGGVFNMLTYDHARPYISSRKARWSWPSFSLEHRRWQEEVNSLKGRTLILRLKEDKFNYIWVDRGGYSDAARELIEDFESLGLRNIFEKESERYAVFELKDFK